MKLALPLWILTVSLAITHPASAAQTEAPAQDNYSAQTDSPIGSIADVENWTTPKPGWLYVLDEGADRRTTGERVWLVDPENSKAMGSIHTGDHADFALSPDGTRLYIASAAQGDTSELAVIDTVSGTVLERAGIDDQRGEQWAPSIFNYGGFRRWLGAASSGSHTRFVRRGFVHSRYLRHADRKISAGYRGSGELWPRPFHVVFNSESV